MGTADGEPNSLAGKWDRSRELIRLGNQLGERFPLWDDAQALECAVLKGSIRTLDDAVAKLEAVHLTFSDGERADGADERALRQVIAWLSAYRCAKARPS
ncbi:MAG TPA: hypothetical protein VGG29_04940 [Caulobacteraceae bacterium]|jgi:hypothetical protein